MTEAVSCGIGGRREVLGRSVDPAGLDAEEGLEDMEAIWLWVGVVLREALRESSL